MSYLWFNLKHQSHCQSFMGGPYILQLTELDLFNKLFGL